jgi:Tol biopolymer transport system component
VKEALSMRRESNYGDRIAAIPMGVRWLISLPASRRDLWKEIIPRLCVTVLAGFALSTITVGCRTHEHFFDVTGDLYVISAVEHYDEALRRAREWMRDASLVAVRTGVGSSKDARTGPSLTFHFDSPSAAHSLYELRFADDGWTSEVVEVGSGATVPPPIHRTDWTLDSVDAWQIALANGGEDFLLRYQDPMTLMDVTLDYWRTGTGEEALAWRVNCYIIYGPGLSMLIDPKTGEIIEVEERSMSGTLVATTPTVPRTPWASLPACNPAAAPVGRVTDLPERIAFQSSRSGLFHLYLMDPDGSNVAQITHGAGIDTSAAWSPDGRRIAYASRTADNLDIYVMDADGSNVVRLTDHPARDDEPTWSPDGTHIAFTSERDGNPNIYIMDADGSNLVLLEDHPLNDDSPDWSPDGCRIAFVSDRDGWPESHIYVIGVDGSNLIQVTDGASLDLGPRWSPDGSRIAYWSVPISEGAGTPNIYVVNQDGSNKLRLSNGPCGGFAPVWSPDGGRIVYSVGRDEPFGSDIFIMDADGSNVQQVTYDGDHNRVCSWRP